MEAIQVIVHFKIKNRSSKDKLKKLFRRESIKFLSRFVDGNRKTPGCVQCQLLQDPQNPDEFSLLETWQSQTDFDQHVESSHFRQFAPFLGSYISSYKVHRMNLVH